MVDCHIVFEFMRVLVYEFLSWGALGLGEFLSL